ncbi:MAG: LPS export ABC transporter permease LptF [Desulfuromonadales bacterium]|nr:LPS export ABC transporter permease LptF [Desulfuromonadales bacterium]MBN2791224.1 LPS export ABC transporter permease LptF [Desulfuromonadales bacterium]
MSALRIQRYVIKEIYTPTILSLVIFTFVLLMGRIPRVTELVINKGVPAAEILQLFAYLMPSFLSITVPLSFLLGILLAFGRLSAESEFIALKASGISLYTLIQPVILLGIVFVFLTGWMTVSVEPSSKAAFREKLFQIASNNLSISLKPGVFTDEFEGLVLFARGTNDQLGIMQDVFISDERNSATPAVITARQGRFISDPDNLRLTLRLSDGSIHRQPEKTAKATYQIIRFTSYDINIDVGGTLDNAKNKYRKRGELSWNELNRDITGTTDKVARNRLLAEKHERIVIAFAPLTLVLVGVPLGLQSQRSGKGAGFALALVVFLIYYVLLSFAGTIADKGILPSAFILWLPNFVFLLGGSYFLHRTATEKPLTIITLPQRLWARWSNRGSVSGGQR